MKENLSGLLKSWLESNVERMAIAIIFAWYFFQVLYFARSIPAGIAPDEIFHISLSEAWSKNLYDFSDTQETYRFGPVSRHPYLYHMLMGFLLQLRPESTSVVQFLRFLNIGVSLVGFGIAVIFLKTVSQSRLVRLSVLCVLSNTLMFVFISGMVSYDTLFYLLSGLSCLLLARLAHRAEPQVFLTLGVVIGFGNLTKISFAPLSLLFLFVAFLLCGRSFFTRSFWSPAMKTPNGIIIFVIAIATFGLNLSLYAKNILIFKQILPLCPNVLGHENCLANPEYVSDLSIISETRGKNLDSFGKFFIDYLKHIERQIPGVFAHRSLYPTAWEMFPHRFFGVTLIIAIVARVFFSTGRKLLISRNVWPFVLISFAYSFIIIFQNYTSYRKLGLLGPGIQFRYHFPVLLTFLYIFFQLVCHEMPRRIALFLVLLICCILSLNGFFFFKRNADKSWFTGTSIQASPAAWQVSIRDSRHQLRTGSN